MIHELYLNKAVFLNVYSKYGNFFQSSLHERGPNKCLCPQ